MFSIARAAFFVVFWLGMLNWQLTDNVWGVTNKLPDNARKLGSWQMFADSVSFVYAHQAGEDFWLSCEDIGALRCSHVAHTIELLPSSGQDIEDFFANYVYYWLPIVYHYWNFQVLHSSAVVQNGAVVAFMGETHAGKSTLAYALSQHDRWQQLTDDRLAFQVEQGQIKLLPILNRPSIRQASRDQLALDEISTEYLPWPAETPRLLRIYHLVLGDPSNEISIRRLSPTEAQPELLKQAFALTLDIADSNKRLMRNYLTLVSQVPVFELVYPRDFESLEQVLLTLEDHLADLEST